MKLCFSTLGCSDYSLDKSLSLAQSLGMDAIEIRGIGGTLDNTAMPDFKPENIESTVRKFDFYGVHPIVLGTSCAFHDKSHHPAAIAEGYAGIDIAKAIGCPYIRVFGNDRPSDEAEANVIDGISEICKYAENKNVTVLLEVHGDYNRLETLIPVINGLSRHKNFGLIWDIAHSERVYRDNWKIFYDGIAPYIRHIHIKDRTRTPVEGEIPLKLPGDGDIPIVNIMKFMESIGYDGYYSLEWERAHYPKMQPIEVALDSFIKITQKI